MHRLCEQDSNNGEVLYAICPHKSSLQCFFEKYYEKILSTQNFENDHQIPEGSYLLKIYYLNII